MFDNLTKALGWSALLHLLVVAGLWYTYQPVQVMQLIQPKAIEAFVYQPPHPKPPLSKTADTEPAQPIAEPSPEVTGTEETPAIAPVKTVPVAIPEKPVASQPPVMSATDQQTDQPHDNTHQPTDATHITNPMPGTQAPITLAERSLAIASRRHSEISSAAIAASQQRPDLRDRPATTAKAQLKPEHAADNVLMVLSDGSFIEKIGHYCYHANQGANLRADISSMKPVPCGENKNAALYERIMSKVGQDRR